MLPNQSDTYRYVYSQPSYPETNISVGLFPYECLFGDLFETLRWVVVQSLWLLCCVTVWLFVRQCDKKK